ncbi:phosphotransferase [Puniceicoccus vermicola]|uniref:Phosphotransferase n=1 Tax=Puniceicoccus vermicola TaxID=388746 RepID=A0A7X1E4K5_9BACT|nr:phosphotransferase [Puniceicoccus vermicola]
MTLPAAKISIPEALAADLEAFPADPFPGEAIPIASGASGRRFFRILRGEQTRVLMAYPPEPHENLLFSAIGHALRAEKIPVPKILSENRERGWVWLEDLGERDLYSAREEKSERLLYYDQALETLHRIQQLPEDLFADRDIETLPGFDQELYQFEQRYFRHELVDRLAPNFPIPATLEVEMKELETRLISKPTTWVHRDFQSKNLMIDLEGRIRVVDFQGIRRGHRYYDLASLLCDPYVNLPADERQQNFEDFCQLSSLSPQEEQKDFSSACCQRLMQALGAYGRFGLGGRVEFFQTKIPVALALLQSSANEAQLPGLAHLAGQLKNLDLPATAQVPEVKPVPRK